MPIGRVQRKPSNETLTSNIAGGSGGGVGGGGGGGGGGAIDSSTLDSRMSSAEIPQMELLKVNYVHQCKEALMHKPSDLLPSSQRHSRPLPPPQQLQQLQQHHHQQQQQQIHHQQQQQHQPQQPQLTVNYNNKFGRPNKTVISSGRTAVGGGKGQAPLPPPTIESWQLLQQSSGAKQTPPVIKPQRDRETDINCSACCSEASNCGSCSSEESEQSLDSNGMPMDGCEKSNSWNYRSKLSTCDMRRDLARAGIKSRADRIARIEQSECEHRNHRASLPAPLSRETEAPPQPRRQAPVPAMSLLPPMKEPNTRRRPVSMLSPSTSTAGATVGDSVKDDCCDCAVVCRSSSAGRRRSPSPAGCAGNRPSQKLVESHRYSLEARHFVSRIPQLQPQPQRTTHPDSGIQAAPKQQQQQQQLQQLQQQRTKPQLIPVLYADVKPKQKITAPAAPKRVEQKDTEKDLELLSGFEQQLMRNASAHQRVKMERIHIRPKKRQPLLIINQLNSSTVAAAASGAALDPSSENSCCLSPDEGKTDERRTCGYKNCNYAKCPMSDTPPSPSSPSPTTMSEQKLKRLSLESCCSDSGVSSSNDTKEQHYQIKANNMKNLAKCADCVKVLQDQAQLPSPSEQRKLKEMEMEVGTQIKIHVNKSPPQPMGDPNDVQNFAKKSLTKVTTDELLTAAKVATKQCNIENDLMNNLRPRPNNTTNTNNNTTTIRIDDDWTPEGQQQQQQSQQQQQHNGSSDGRKPINANDNCVKIFVRSSSQSDGVTSVNRISINQTAYTNTNCCYASSSSSASTSSTASSSSGCGTSCSLADGLSLCDSEKDSERCCCSRNETHNKQQKQQKQQQHLQLQQHQHQLQHQRGVFSRTDTLRACPPSPLGSELSCVTCRTQTSCSSSSNATIKAPLSTDGSALSCDAIAVGGVFWNNSYFYHHHHEHEHEHDHETEQEPCYCSLSSCDDDNCSYYELDAAACHYNNNSNNMDAHAHANHNGLHIGAVDCCDMAATTMTVPLRQQQHQPIMQRQLLQQQQQHNIMSNKKIMRRTDVIHELRPRSIDGVGGLDSGISVNGDNGSSPDSEHMQNQQDSEARRLKRGHVLSELLETERIYVNEMSSILKGYCDQMQSEDLMHLVPDRLQGKEDILFGNLHELYTFHNEIFLKDLENCISTTELVALCFVQRRDTFYRLYSFYCQNIPRSERLRETLVDTHLFLQECQKRLGHKLPLAAYLLKPVQRITKYQLLLKDLLRFSDSGSCTKELQKALDCMLIVLKCVNDSMHQVAITGFPSDLSQQGELLLQDSFQVWSESKKDIRLRIKHQQRHIFLYQKSMLFCKQTSKPGHNKSTYQFKHHLKMSQIGLTESVRGDTKRFEVWLQGRQEVHTLQAPSIEIKNKWVAEIKRVLLNQLEELKGEKIKQYGLNHRGLRQTTSWDTPNVLLCTQRNISCDASSESSNRNSNCSSSGDDNCTPLPQTISVLTSAVSSSATHGSSGGGGGSITSSNASNSSGGSSGGGGGGGGSTTIDKEQQEACGWSSECSNSEDEMSIIEDNSTPGSKFIALADYVAMGHSEVSMREGDNIELLKVGCAGWWYVRVLDANTEGWTPAAFLESLNRKSSRSSSRNQERLSLPNKFTD